ncbi:MAG: PEP/pyruvate-binding domain-containing protein [Acidimicrobiia bacterium]
MFPLTDDRALDIELAGAKAAWLARGLRADLPILPGFVVSATASREYLSLGGEALAESGSGAARMAIIRADPPAVLEELEAATADWSEPLVARSSSILEAGGEWSGAFTSYLDLRHGELAVGVRGCWASIFSANTLERFEASGKDPREAPMAVLVQPALQTDFGGTARLVGDVVEVAAVRGSPAPLVQGWEPGVAARVDAEGGIDGPAAIELLDTELINQVADLLVTAHTEIGATGCEWGIASGDVFLFQLTRSVQPSVDESSTLVPELAGSEAERIGALVRRYPGPLGEALVLPWALGLRSPDLSVPVVTLEANLDSIDEIRQAAERLTAQVWAQPRGQANESARRALQALRGTDPAEAIGRIVDLRPPDPEAAGMILGLIDALADATTRTGLITQPELIWQVEPADVGKAMAGETLTRRERYGFDRWEPFTASVVTATGKRAQGQSAGPGVAAGRMCRVLDTEDMESFRPRDVLVSTHPVPNLAPLLWDASGIVTTGGSAGAHLFESARAVGIPAVCGIRLEEVLGGDLAAVEGEYVLAVDGSNGTVTAAPW